MLRATRNTRAGTYTPDYGLHCSRYMRKIRFVCIFKTRKKAPEKYV